jgi:hypothetical protein
VIVKRTTILPASRAVVFQKLQQPETLQYIARPFAAFEPVGEPLREWTEGSRTSYHFRLFGVIPFCTHTICIVRFDPDGISSQEENEHVPVWNHEIRLVKLGGSHTEYTDRVEIRAGWKTIFIWLWAKAFYAHRQRKWVKLLGE